MLIREVHININNHIDKDNKKCYESYIDCSGSSEFSNFFIRTQIITPSDFY